MARTKSRIGGSIASFFNRPASALIEDLRAASDPSRLIPAVEGDIPPLFII